MNMKEIWSQSEIWKANSTAAACLSTFITAAHISASILSVSPLGLNFPLPLDPHRFRPGLSFGANNNISNFCINTYSIIIINVYPLLLSTPTMVLVEMGSLLNTDAEVYTEVALDEVPEEDMESVDLEAAALTSAS